MARRSWPIFHFRLCLGTNRQPTAERFTPDYKTLQNTGKLEFGQIRDVLLCRMGELLDTTEGGMKIRLDETSGIEHWSQDVSKTLAQFDRVHRLISSLYGTHFTL